MTAQPSREAPAPPPHVPGETHPCYRCGREFPVETFQARTAKCGGGRIWRCQECRQSYNRQWWHRRGGLAGMSERMRQSNFERTRRWREQNREKVREINRQKWHRKSTDERTGQQRDQRLAVRIEAAVEEGRTAFGSADFVVAVREVPWRRDRTTWIAYALPMGMGTPGGVVVLHVTRVGGVWGARMSPTLEVRYRRAAQYALWRLERRWSGGR